jgi:serine/threonine protein kinase
VVSDGQILADKYRVERVLGRGAMGVVVAAHHIRLDEKVAIKFLLPEAVGNAEVVGRFEREARAAIRIKSEHVARVLDVGTLEGGEPYMVMEYLEGLDLAAWLRERGPLPIEQAVEFVLQASEAIAEAHVLGIVHRDLKPENLFVVRRVDGVSSIKVLDFGISKVVAPGTLDAKLTRTTAVMGSPLYMPPEQMVASRTVDARADIWSLGVILFELMAGQAPFMGESLIEIGMKVANEAPRSLRALRPDVPVALEAIVLRCLEKDRERRYPNVAELALALIDFGPLRGRSSVDRITRTIEEAGLSSPAPAAAPSSGQGHDAPAAIAGADTGAPWGWGSPSSAPRKKARTAFVVGALLVIVSGGVALSAKLRRTSHAPPGLGAPLAPPPPSTEPPAEQATEVPTEHQTEHQTFSPARSSSIKASSSAPKPSTKPSPKLSPKAAHKRSIFDDR